MRKYPFVKQNGNKDCGVACLSMIIQYYQGYVPIEKLRQETKTDQTGVSAYNLIACAKELGFHAKGLKGTLEQLEAGNLVLPFIAHVLLEQQLGHYVVVYQIDKKKKQLLIADPSDRIKKISYEEFLQIWSGIVITLYPYKKLPLYNQKFSFQKFLLSLVGQYRFELIQLFLLSIFISIFSILQSFFFDFFSNKLSISKQEEPYFFLFYFFLGILILKQITSYIRHDLLMRMNMKIDYFLHHDIFEALLYLPYRFYRTRTTGEITSKINDLEFVKSFIGDFVTTILVDSFLGFICLVVLCFLNLKLAFLSLIFGLLLLSVQFLFRGNLKKAVKQVQMKRADSISHMVESIHGFQTIKGLRLEKETLQTYLLKYRIYMNQTFLFAKTSLKEMILKEGIQDLVSLTILFVGILELIQGRITVGKLISIQMLVSYFMIPFHSLFSISLNYHEVKSILEHLTELFYQEKKVLAFDCSMNFPIEISSLSYSFQESQFVLKNLSFTIEKGEKILLVGSSGSGKSTLMKLLVKYYPVPRNCILFRKIDINDIKENQVEKFIAYISQEEILFTGSLWYNLTLNRKIAEEKVLEIARVCEVDRIANQNQLGYFRLLEENGFRLSGGEKERIILARTLLQNCPFLIIDEGMGQMDVSQERRILKNILVYDPTLTLIVVSHRRDNQDLFGRVIELEHGKKRKDLIKNDGF